VLPYNFQDTHILGASRGHLCDSVASCYYVMLMHISEAWQTGSIMLSKFTCLSVSNVEVGADIDWDRRVTSKVPVIHSLEP